MHQWHVLEDFEEASISAADFIAQQIHAAIELHGECHIALPGGNTPARCLELLAKKNLRWNAIHWYLGDERCVPEGHEERNDVMLEHHLWSKLPRAMIHRIPAELGADAAAAEYRRLVDQLVAFDIVFLGMGEDGHTASLFPSNDALVDPRSVVPVYHAPKPPGERVSLGVSTIKKAGCRVILTAGESKAPILRRIRNSELLPVNRIGQINWFVDQQAWDAV